jgi:glutamyl-tRNA synthetase
VSPEPVFPAAPRVRFAPSPTGYLHVGSARAALFNWLFARRHGGTFILRIEDTDTERNREEWVGGISQSLAWLGLDPDEGPFRQSERSGRYGAAIEALWDDGALYACDCTREEVEARRAEGSPPGYDGFCRERGLARSERTALRFRTPDEGETVVQDLIRGEVVFPHAAMEDFVCVKSDGQPLFVLANVVDDRDMAISHVIRGEDLLPTTPKGILVWAALDRAAEGQAGRGESLTLPNFAHLPLLVDEARRKLAKRREDTAVEAYRDRGYLPDALRNYLALLGWSPPGDQEKVPVATLVEHFALEDVHKAPAFFDTKKLAHLNGEYLRELPVDRFVDAARPWLDPGAPGWHPGTFLEARIPWPPERYDPARFAALAPLVQERVSTLAEVTGMVDFLFLDDPAIDEDSWARALAGDEGAPAILDEAQARYAALAEWTAPELHRATTELAEAVGRKLGKAQAPIRVAVTGRRVGPPLFESLALLGRDEVLRRLGAARARLRPPG